MALFLFVVAVALVVHSYVLYPLTLFLLDGLTRAGAYVRSLRAGRGASSRGGFEPSVSVLVTAQEPFTAVAQTVSACLGTDYPHQKLEIILGSEDVDPDEAVLRAGGARVAMASPEAPTAEVLNRCIPDAHGDIVVLTDARMGLEPAAISELVQHFQDADVAAVVGRVRKLDARGVDSGETTAGLYAALVQHYEGQHGAVMGSSGGFYAIRRSLYTRLPEGSDGAFMAPVRLVAAGYKVLYEPRAVATRASSRVGVDEFGRHARRSAERLRSLRHTTELFSPAAGFRWYAFWSHPVLRAFVTPALMMVAFVANLFLVSRPVFQVTLATQVAFYVLALLGRARMLRGSLRGTASLAYGFVSMNAANAVGLYRVARPEVKPALGAARA